nr:DUF3833 family protein [Jiella sonneratiae]
MAATASAAGPAAARHAEAAELSLLRFFDGRARSHGTTTPLIGRAETFTATFTGTVAGRHLSLDERFRFEDGRRLQHWDLTRTARGRYEGTVRTELGDGTMAPPVRVEGHGFAGGAVLAYDGYAPGGGRILLGFRHVMRRLGPDRVENRVTIAKFGLPIAHADVIFRRAGR